MSLIGRNRVVVKDEEGDDNVSRILELSRNFVPPLDRSIIETIDIPDEEDAQDAQNAQNQSQYVDLTGDDPPPPSFNQYDKPVGRNICIPDHLFKHKIEHNDMTLKKGVVVELTERLGRWKAGFVIIEKIYHWYNGMWVRGFALARTNRLGGQLPRMMNEVFLIHEIDADDRRPDEAQAMVEFKVDIILRTRNLQFTNADFPQFRYEKQLYTKEKCYNEGMLACRWKLRHVYRSAATRKKGQVLEHALLHLNKADVPKRRFQVPDYERLKAWRGGKTRGGAYIPEELQDDVKIIFEHDQAAHMGQEWVNKRPGQKYTFIDTFSGAGGTSCGVRQAGFLVKAAVDLWAPACATYLLNFSANGTDVFEMDVFDFCTSTDPSLLFENVRVDMLHISPPCQFWSPAHTTVGKDDERNIAALFACRALIEKTKPRIFTLEQTFGILFDRNSDYFNALVHGFTELGYSIRWRAVKLWNWGLPARRNRLIMIGSCPGEKLPTFPKDTHSENPHGETRPLNTVAHALAKIPENANDPLHQVDSVKHYNPPQPRQDKHLPLYRAITTDGGRNYHPDGHRDFTFREYATLQGFPVNYQFQAPSVKKQIGNAFPPIVVKTLYNHLRKWLEKVDQVRAAGNVIKIEDRKSDAVDIEGSPERKRSARVRRQDLRIQRERGLRKSRSSSPMAHSSRRISGRRACSISSDESSGTIGRSEDGTDAFSRM